jgi:hypothetical protein
MCAMGVSSASKNRGVIIGPLRACFPFLIIVVPESVFFLRNGMTCAHPPGTRVQIVYAENDDGVHDVLSIHAVP